MNWSLAQNTSKPVFVSVPDVRTLLADLTERFEARKGFTIATLNLDHVVKLACDHTFSSSYSEHTHITADGNPIVWLSRLAGRKIELIPGSELIGPVAEIAARQGVPVGLFGATENSLQAAANSLQERFPKLKVTFLKAPSMGFDPNGDEAGDAINGIASSGARLVFLALGAPRQECFAARAQRSMPEVGFLSIGAGLDFISGAQRRAPYWVRRLMLEWLWRLLLSPKRLAGRYLACALALPKLILRALSCRWSGKA